METLPKFKRGGKMLRYILKRVGMGFVTIWVIITLTFIIMHSVPGDPFAKEGKMPEAVYNNLLRHYDLDKPKVEQYFNYLKNVARLDLGPSIKSSSRTVNDYIEDNFPVSLRLGLTALSFASCFGIMLGILAALKRNKVPDYICMMLAIIGVSVPSFIISTLMVEFFSLRLGLLPTSGWGTWKQAIMPTIALSMMPLAYIARMMRSSMIEVLGQDYIRTAKAKGLSQRKIITRHALRNAMIPVVTVIGITLANMVVGSFIIENIFRIPGLGKYFIQSVLNRDYPVILGTTIFYSTILVFMNVIVDILYVLIDPRITLASQKKGLLDKIFKKQEVVNSDWGV
jgi:ABC-type dipeptide/oligopeptide/nickel transport system permease component